MTALRVSRGSVGIYCCLNLPGLVPRRMAMLGLIGGPMLIASFVLILFGVYENGSTPAFLMALPEIAWEASLGIYAAWKGFRPSPITSDTWASGSDRVRLHTP